jgi:hypothetical protein
MIRTHKSKYFCGNEISQYGQQQGYLDYGTLSRAFDAVLVNDITKLFYTDINGEYSEPEYINGFDEDSGYDDPEIFQYFIISNQGAELLQEYTNDPVFYLPVIDCYIWGVTHFGTCWDYVLTDVKLEV